MIREAGIMKLLEGTVEEYKKRHDEIWPDLVEEIKEHGAKNYSIYFNEETNELFSYLEIEDAEGFCFLERDKLNQIPPKKHTSTPPSPYCDEYFNNLNGRITYIEASRGCPFSCAYCLSGQLQGLRYFDTDSVFDSIVKLSHSGTKTIKFIDRTFNADASKADAILNYIKKPNF